MKKSFMKIIILLLFGVVIVFGFYFYSYSRIKGEIEVRINGELSAVYDLKCVYESNEQKEEEINYKQKEEKTYFKNKGIGYGKYIYSFCIKEDNLEINPQFIYFKTSMWKSEKLYLKVDLYESEEDWIANITFKDKQGYTVRKQFEQEQINDMKIQMGP